MEGKTQKGWDVGPDSALMLTLMLCNDVTMLSMLALVTMQVHCYIHFWCIPTPANTDK